MTLSTTLLQLLMDPMHGSHLFGDASNVDTRSTHRLSLDDGYLRRGVVQFRRLSQAQKVVEYVSGSTRWYV